MITDKTIKNINNLFESVECKKILIEILNKVNYRMCLNTNPIENVRLFLADVILIGSIFDVKATEMAEIYSNPNNYLTKKVMDYYKCKNINLSIKEKFYNYSTSIFKDICFHGTNSRWDNNFYNLGKEENFNKDALLKINNIYEKYGYFRALEGKLLDRTNDKYFFTTLSVNSALFYALQSPEYLNRFVARSDYYKLDTYKYDRQALYRLDRKACLNNVKKEVKKFGFSSNDKSAVIDNTKKLYDYAITTNLQRKVIIAKSITNNYNYNLDVNNYKLLDLLRLSSPEFHSVTDFEVFTKNIIGEFKLPFISKYLKHRLPIKNKKFIYIDNKKYYPDFYSLGKFSSSKCYFLDKNIDLWNCETLNSKSINTEVKYTLISDYFPNSKKAKKLLKDWEQRFTKNEVAQSYKQKLLSQIDNIKNQDLELQVKLLKNISEGIGLRYISILHYNKYFKHVNHAFLYDYSKVLGRLIYKKYKEGTLITGAMIEKQLEFYNQLLSNPQNIIKKELPVKIIKGEIKL